MKLKIAVLMGGKSLERSISLKSGERVANALRERGYAVVELDVDDLLVPTLLQQSPDVAYIALHGKHGEDGTIQELLEMLEIPYTGPGPLSSIIGFNKILSKELFMANGIYTPRYHTFSAPTIQEMGASKLLPKTWETLGSPVVVKPAAQGSALGVKVVRRFEDLADAIIAALGYDERVLIEEFIQGQEISVSILGTEEPVAFPPVEIVPKSGFFDFESRYTPGKTEYFAPARIDEKTLARVNDVALKAHKLLRCKDVSRVDMIVDKSGIPYVLELNISPGMTETSLLPLAAEAAGIAFDELVEKLIRAALAKK
ncbi:MAG: D-alanine--D-alanine ligase [Actinomycetota bacterium]|nr:D-alanine--D-alanine ligase [Actinomycetota bacterium]